ncbi:MAG: hypothetical protein ACKVP4_00980 [Hyphomicrobium sp.]
MTTPDIPEITHLSAEQLLTLRNGIDERLDAVRAAFVDQANALGLTVTNAAGKKSKRKPRVITKEE